jgi:hypothetical protein
LELESLLLLGNMSNDVLIFNQKLGNWLIEYNFNRPHQSLDYFTPIAFTQKYSKVSNMYSSHTLFCNILQPMLKYLQKVSMC